MQFKYVRDPLFCGCVMAYLLNRFLVKPLWPGFTFFHSHLNDLLCIPFWLPVLLLLHRKLGLRKHDGPPQSAEVFLYLVAWSLWFEALGPTLPHFRAHMVGDPWDVTAYSCGALGAMLFWHRGAGRPAEANAS
jgi:hypothetical protein